MTKADIRAYLGEFFNRPKGKWNVISWGLSHWFVFAWMGLLILTAILSQEVGELLLIFGFIFGSFLVMYFLIAKGR